MLLSNRRISEELVHENIVIQPYFRAQLQPTSYDVILGPDFKFAHTREHMPFGNIDPSMDSSEFFFDIRPPQGSAVSLEPGAFALGSTYEVIALGPNIAAQIEGKSSLGRLGLQVHATAGFIDPGFDGQVTLELSNVGSMPIFLYPGMKVAQILFYLLPEPATILYGSHSAGSHYQNQAGPTLSKSHQNFNIINVYGDTNEV